MARCTSATLSAWRSRLSCVTRAPSCSGTSWIHVSRGSERARIACGRVFVSTGMARGGNARALGNARGTHAAATAAESGAALDAGGADAAGSSIADARSEKADGPMKKETCMQSLVIVESPSKAATINKYLGDAYKVLATFGHVRDLVAKGGSVEVVSGAESPTSSSSASCSDSCGGDVAAPSYSFRFQWEIAEGKQEKTIESLEKLMREGRVAEVVLATDPDREGEAISWHVNEILNERGLLSLPGADMDGKPNTIPVRRVTFTEVTRAAILDAFSDPDKSRNLSQSLINAYKARRALDYLVGFGVSPLLWSRLPGTRSAGRVQSAALRLICKREESIERFMPEEYWSVSADMESERGDVFVAALNSVNGEKLSRLGLRDEEQTLEVLKLISECDLTVKSVKQTERTRKQPSPFTTSSLQQEANSRFGMSSSSTMRAAQMLYEGNLGIADGAGLITYHRTDGLDLSPDAVERVREVGTATFGRALVAAQAVAYKSKRKRAEEAHEAIRPTDPSILPSDVVGRVDASLARVYSLIWYRTLASQMRPARYLSTRVEVEGLRAEGGSGDCERVGLVASSSKCVFEGWRAAYELALGALKDAPAGEDVGDEPATDGELMDHASDGNLESLKDGMSVECLRTDKKQHFTSPPARYSEGRLVKDMEEAGIGRPSTYASTIKLLYDRQYLDRSSGGGQLRPSPRGRLLSCFLDHFFERYFNVDFTAEIEERLDEVCAGDLEWNKMLENFWVPFEDIVRRVKDTSGREVVDAMNDELAMRIFNVLAQKLDGMSTGSDAEGGVACADRVRTCPACGSGSLTLKPSRSQGAFLGCSNYEDSGCKFTVPLDIAVLADLMGALHAEGLVGRKVPKSKLKELGLVRDSTVVGVHPQTGLEILSKFGPYGPYVEMASDKAGGKPRRANSKGFDSVDVDTACDLLAMAGDTGRPLGAHPSTGKEVTLHIGAFGLYVKHAGSKASIKAIETQEYASVTIDAAVGALEAKTSGGRRRKKEGGKKEEGDVGADGKESNLPSEEKVPTLTSVKVTRKRKKKPTAVVEEADSRGDLATQESARG